MKPMTHNGPPEAAQRRMLLSLAHPDDESFGMGGAIARYARQGVEITLICSTNGDVGTVAPEHMNGYKTVAELRIAELHCAAETLGIHQVITYGYRDSGMMGAAENENPACLWQADRAAVEARVVADIRRTRPHVVITFDPYGGYGHPDHILMHEVTTSAFFKAGDPECYPDQLDNGLEPHQPAKLYYSTFPRLPLRMMLLLARLRGQDPRRLGVNQDLNLQAALDHTMPAHARIDVSAYQEMWDAASACHASQANPRQESRLLAAVRRLTFHDLEFTRAWPEPRPGEPIERDLFEDMA